jgi:hypothetical protein
MITNFNFTHTRNSNVSSRHKCNKIKLRRLGRHILATSLALGERNIEKYINMDSKDCSDKI